MGSGSLSEGSVRSVSPYQSDMTALLFDISSRCYRPEQANKQTIARVAVAGD